MSHTRTITFDRADFSRKELVAGDGDYRWIATDDNGGVRVLEDNLVEDDEEFTIFISPIAASTGFGVGKGLFDITIENDDEPNWEVTLSSASISEKGQSSSMLRIYTGGGVFPDNVDFTIDLSADSTASLDTDYVLNEDQPTLPDGNEEVFTTFTAKDDAVDDPDETIIFIVSRVSPSEELATLTLLITEGGTVERTADDSTLDEGGDRLLRYTVVATTGDDTQPAVGFSMDVDVSTADGDATAGDDYNSHTKTLTFDRADFSRKETVGGSNDYRWIARDVGEVSIRDDEVVEADETFTIELDDVDSESGFGVTQGSVEITVESDDRWGLSVSVAPSFVREGETEDVTLSVGVVNQNGARASDTLCITPFAITGSLGIAGTATGGTDYTYTETAGSLTSISLSSCEVSKSVSLRIVGVTDEEREQRETVLFTPSVTTGVTYIGLGTDLHTPGVFQVRDPIPGPRAGLTFEGLDAPPAADARRIKGIARGKFTARFRFNEQVSGFTLSDVTYSTNANTTRTGSPMALFLLNFTTVREGYEYTVDVVPSVNGEAFIDIVVGSVTSVRMTFQTRGSTELRCGSTYPPTLITSERSARMLREVWRSAVPSASSTIPPRSTITPSEGCSTAIHSS